MSSVEYDTLIRVLTGYPADSAQAQEQIKAWNEKGNSLLTGFANDQARTDKLEASSTAKEGKSPAPVLPFVAKDES